MSDNHSKHDGCAFPDEPCNQLTFAAAMALDPSDVECCLHPEGGESPWLSLDKHKYLSLYQLRMRYFRRARPKRSRVQEMALALCGELESPSVIVDAAKRYEEAIRAVCEWFRGPQCAYSTWADAIEREFLEPR